MKSVLAAAVAVFLAGTTYADTVTVSMKAVDGVTVHGEVHTPDNADKSAPLILLFHQGGGDSRGEYGPIVPRLIDAGYNLITIDQRRGGDRFNGINRTLAGVGNTEYSYCDVLPDLEAALRFAHEQGFSGPVATWGSSYSAALVFQLGALYPDEIDAILAFSPASGEPMDGCNPESFSEQLTQPVLALRPIGELQVAYVPGQMKLFEDHGHQTYVADPGVHGSSMLNEARVGAPTDDTWNVVLSFLSRNLTAGN